MAPTTSNPSGGNPAPQYKEKTNAIAALMSRHTSSPSLTFLSSLSKSKNSFTALKKTPAQLAAEREDYELDRLVQYDDNMGVGMFAPNESKRKEQEEKRARELEDRKLKARLGLSKGKRKGSEWEGVSGVAKAREQESDDEEELGRSGVGRAKKRKRISVPEGVEGNPPTVDSQQKNADVDMTETHSQHDGERKLNNEIKEAEQAADAAPEEKPDATVDIDGGSNTDTKAKRKRKKKKKSKPKSQLAEKIND